MSDIYFFTDVDLLNEQTSEQAFGPVVGNEETQYRVTSIHSAHVSSSELKDHYEKKYVNDTLVGENKYYIENKNIK